MSYILHGPNFANRVNIEEFLQEQGIVNNSMIYILTECIDYLGVMLMTESLCSYFMKFRIHCMKLTNSSPFALII